jgi:hypothetical protein
MVALKPKKRAPRKQPPTFTGTFTESQQGEFNKALRQCGFLPAFTIDQASVADVMDLLSVDVVAKQVGELTADFDGKGKPELPSPPPSDRYVDAYNSAVRNCTHQGSLQETLYQREWQCLLCGKVVKRSDML